MNRVRRGGALNSSNHFIALIAIAAAFSAHTAFAGPLYRPGQEQRTVTASSYQVSVQKNGRVDVSLLNGEPVFVNAYPAVLFEGEEEWTELDIASRYTFREQVNETLGQGQALIMAKGNCEWAIRTYATQPFFTVQAVFSNTTKKPVRVRAVSPWRTGGTRKPGGVWLGNNTEHARALTLQEQPPGFVSTGVAQEWPMESRWHIGLHNGETGRSLIAGFLELNEDVPSFSVDRQQEDDAEARALLFETTTTFEEPVEVAPGERLAMPIVYFAVSEPDPLVGLRRFGQALARFNGIRADRSETQSGVTRDSAQFFRGDRSALARLTPNAPATWEDAIDALTVAAHLFHFTPYFWRADTAQERYGWAGATESQRLAWISGLALSGSVLPHAGDSEVHEALTRLIPPLDRSAHPVDLFRNDRPQIWALPMDESGEHVVVGLFNWDDDVTAAVEIDFAALGLARNAFYTVYDSWPRQYMGTASKRLRVAVLPSSVRILSLRRHQDWPAVLSTGDHITTASNQADDWEWDAAAKTLSGSVIPQDGKRVRIDVLVPERYDAIASTSDNIRVEWQDNSRVLFLDVSGEDAAWHVEFE